MPKIEVYFQNGRSAKLDMSAVTFRADGDVCFDFLDIPDEEIVTNADLIRHGALVNWDAVSFVRLLPERDEEDE
jgi:hypothetical protein